MAFINLQRFAVTMMSDMIDPEVLGQMISAQLPKAIKFAGIAPVDTTLEGQAGTTITLPKWKYIGDAIDVAEGGAIDFTKLAKKSEQYTIKKVGKGVEITDEAMLSGYGDPVGEAQAQIRMAIASKVDNDIVATAKAAPLSVSHKFDLDLIDQVEVTFEDAPDAIEAEDAGTTGVLFVSYKDAAKLRKAASNTWTRASELGDDVLISGAFGELQGWEIVRTRKLNEGEGIAVKTGALKTFMKRNITVEADRDIVHKLTMMTADEHYVVALVDETKVVKILALPVAADADISAAMTAAGLSDLFGKAPTDLQANIEIGANDEITGTLKYVADYSAAGYLGDEKSGNFLCLHFACTGAQTLKAYLVGGIHDESTLDSDGLLISRITDKNTQKVRITATAADGTVTVREYGLSGLVLETA